ncbi:hypothetical protein T01_4925 [Trichinella spiralis]|uniref:Uncharacterized protein n=1 Tax=Trichinella spiralis TaxID=6334 RepID=A0A0V1ARW5_TRISP|nr:hypothetical protein T01_3444 [Trichinella spiralis]KRY27537.1 hypothetical protein T01_4925 [Trichinella spiralis]
MVLLKRPRRSIIGLLELHFVCITCCEVVQQVSNLSLCIYSLQANSIQFRQIPMYPFPLEQIIEFTMQIYAQSLHLLFAVGESINTPKIDAT